MTNETFEWELAIARSMSRLERPLYWQGFTRGLHRTFYGEAAVNASEHRAWLAMHQSADPRNEDRYQGYRDGLEVCASPAAMHERPPASSDRRSASRAFNAPGRADDRECRAAPEGRCAGP